MKFQRILYQQYSDITVIILSQIFISIIKFIICSMIAKLNRVQTINKIVKTIIAVSTCSQFSFNKMSANTSVNKNLRADSILKNYFNVRSQMSNANMVELIDRLKNVKVSSGFFNDHRWIHLNVTIQKNIRAFTIPDQLKILQGLTKLNNFNDLFNIIVSNLSSNIQALNPNQKSLLLYFMAKSSKVKPEIIRNLSDSLIIQLNNKDMQLKYGRQVQKNIRKKLKKDNQENQKKTQEQSLFDDEIDINSKSPKSQSEVECRNLILCLWSLQKMKIRDDILEQCLIKQFIRPNIPNMPANLFPLLLSTLRMKGMQNKRIFEEVVFELWERQNQLIQLDRDKLKMLTCMLCKPLIHKQENKPQKRSQQNKEQLTESKRKIQLQQKRNKLILWLMETLCLKHEHGQEYLFATSAYQILSNVSQADIIDIELYERYLQIICNDLSKIQTKQVVYLLSILEQVMKISKKSANRKKSQQKEFATQAQFHHHLEQHYKTLTEHLLKNIMKFFNRTDQNNPARVALRKMVTSGFLVLPNNLKRNVIHQDRLARQKSLAIPSQIQEHSKDQHNTFKTSKINQKDTQTKNKQKRFEKSSQKQPKNDRKQQRRQGPKKHYIK